MKTTIYFITRSYPNIGNSSGGGALAREAQVKTLEKHGYDVKVIVPNPNKKTEKTLKILKIGFKWNKKIDSLKERIGLSVDSYERWSKAIIKELKNKITPKDIIISVTGGSADTFYAGIKLKEETNCKLVLSYHDPINYTNVNGIYVDNKFHFKRNRFEKKAVNIADLIFTSSKSFQDRLNNTFNNIENKVYNLYFGYNVLEKLNDKIYHSPYTVAYTGSFNKHQSPETLYKLKNKNIKLLFLGNYDSYAPIKNYINNEEFKGSLEHDEYLNFALKNIDIGFVSLQSEYLSVCFPSKIFEYLNLGLPMIAALPEGDAMNFINNYNIGKAFHYTDLNGMLNYINSVDSDCLKIQRENIIKIREDYYFENSLSEMNTYIEKIK